MNRTKIKLESPEKVSDFINFCSKYDNDINLYDGSTIIDAKSIIGVFSIQEGKTIEVEMMGVNKDEIIDFYKKLNMYKEWNEKER